MLNLHRCQVNPRISSSHALAGKKVYIPIMAEGASDAVTSCFRWLGIEAEVTPPSNRRTQELGARFVNGDECYPAVVTLGDLLRVAERPNFSPSRSVFLMPASEGPCRFGQYARFLKKVLCETGYGDVQVLSPTDRDGYAEFGDIATSFQRMAWRAVVASEVLHKALLRTRPYETTPGTAGRIYEECLGDLCNTIESACASTSCQLRSLVECMTRARERFRKVPVRYDPEVPLVGVVGEIFCRLNSFSNDDLIRRLESHKAEAWLSGVAEWVGYANEIQARNLRLCGRAFSLEMIGARLRAHVQRADEHALEKPFEEDCHKEPDIQDVLDLATPYLPACGVLGEMVLSVGRAAYMAKQGVDGIIDISPFTCMNGIVSEAIYPKLSKDHGGIPIRNFYFDGTQTDLDRDLGVYLELARSYREKKRQVRSYPPYFSQSLAVQT
jgi:predicted nucleotide-binding protein (sugar kinase/HSP70/actin superfamily)